MCGICAAIYLRKAGTCDNVKSKETSLQDLERLKRRGPNHFQEISCSLEDEVDLHFSSSVLHLRGDTPTWQPIEDYDGNVFLWNGEMFDGLEVDKADSDSKVLSKKLFNCTGVTEVLSTLSSIKGPFAFIFYQNTGLLWFGRDLFGRRSLLWSSENDWFCLSSVSSKLQKWDEVSTAGLFCLDLTQSYVKKSFIVNLYPWSSTPSGLTLQENHKPVTSNFEICYKPQTTLPSPVSNFLNRTLPSDDTDLNSIFRTTNKDEQTVNESDLFSKLLEVPVLNETVTEFEKVLSESVNVRVHNHCHLCKKCYEVKSENDFNEGCGHSSVGVLFSGGLDSIVIACLADRHVLPDEPIDLINVAFASNSSLKSSSDLIGHPAFETPDRITGRKGVAALRNVCPKRKWNFLEVNVTEEDLICKRTSIICHLLNPSYTVLDDSIGCALWFAARGNGIVETEEGHKNYNSPVRVLLVGMGADEQLGGYARHRAKFNSSGWVGLLEELSIELDRIGSRNLGRDDRIIADHGVESRYPFLDENVVSYLNSLPVWLKMNLYYPRGVGEKVLLRLLAFKLGLTEAAALPKRAIQFGSRIARIENSKEKGSDVCERLKPS